MKREVKRKKFNFKRFFIFLLFLVCFCFSIHYLGKIKVKTIIVEGNKRVSDSEIIEAALLSDYPSYIKYNAFKGKRNIKKNPLIKSVKIRRKSNFKVVISVEEYKVLFEIRSTSEYVTSDNSRLDVSLVDVPTLINFVSDDMLLKMIDKFSSLDDEVLSKISEIEYSPNMYDNERFIFYMRDNNMVYVTLNKIKEFNKYNKIKDQIGSSAGILYLDSGNYFEIKN